MTEKTPVLYRCFSIGGLLVPALFPHLARNKANCLCNTIDKDEEMLTDKRTNWDTGKQRAARSTVKDTLVF